MSKSGRELKKLLGRAAGLNESDGDEDDEDDDVSAVGIPQFVSLFNLSHLFCMYFGTWGSVKTGSAS